MATFLVLGLPTLLGTCFLVVFYIGLSRDSARKRHQMHSPYEVLVTFKLDQRPSAMTTSRQNPVVSIADRLGVRRGHA
jgi:hypothetical protein